MSGQILFVYFLAQLNLHTYQLPNLLNTYLETWSFRNICSYYQSKYSVYHNVVSTPLFCFNISILSCVHFHRMQNIPIKWTNKNHQRT